MRLRGKSGVYPGRVYVDDHQLIPTYWEELHVYVEPLKGQYNLSIFSIYCTAGNFGGS